MGIQMSITFRMNTTNQIPKDTIIYEENEVVNSIGLILKGKVEIKNQGCRIILSPGNFLGISDLYAGNYLSTYKAYEDLTLFIFNIKDPRDIEKILTAHKDYSGIMTAVLGRYIIELDKIYLDLKQRSIALYRFLTKQHNHYITIGKSYNISVTPLTIIEKLTEYKSTFENFNDEHEYYKECARIPLDIQKSYFRLSTFLTLHQLEKQSYIIQQYISECIELANYNSDLFNNLMNNNDDCLFKRVAKLAMELGKSGNDNQELSVILDKTIDEINKTEAVFEERLGKTSTINRDTMEKIYYIILSGNREKKSKSISTESSEIEIVNKVFENSLLQILTFSEYDEEKKNKIINYIEEFRQLKDKISVDDHTRKLRRKITDFYYELYKTVFLKAYTTKNSDKVIDLFLNYGFLDEHMLTQEQLIDLYHLEQPKNSNSLCSIYTMRQWLTAIYEGKKEPSKSEFDMDYQEFLRDLKKTRKMSPEEEQDYLINPIKKLDYEIDNMFKYNNRLVYGQISSFVPFLYEEVFLGRIETCFVTIEKINQAIEHLLDIDFSIFYRETVYSNTEIGITREYIMVESFPDIILLPIYGTNMVMWQEIEGRKRTSSGRFLLPSFSNIDLNAFLIKTFGRFRWELCRTIQGPSWNDVTDKSLTSEYCDYIQFYRKNRELSDEKKLKLKLQIQKCRNNSKEVFTQDYEMWILNEAQGAIRLNKPVREIMATYCPFSKKIRERIASQPLFEEAMARYNREKIRKIKELDLRCRILEKDNVNIPKELLDTKNFYLNL